MKYEIRQKKAINSKVYVEKRRELKNISDEEKAEKKAAKLERQIARKNDERAMRKLCPAEREAIAKMERNAKSKNKN